MGKFIDKTGQKFNMLTAKKYLGKSKWLCQCDCGRETIVYSAFLNEIPGRTKIQSCGCLLEKNSPKEENFFKQINTEEKAYILGFISADGCVQPELKRVKIDLKQDDEDILMKIQKVIGHYNQLSHYSQKGIKLEGREYTSSISRLIISSAQWTKDLEQYGVIKNKTDSLECKVELIPREFWKDFLRGVVDGDGSISFSPNSKSKTANFTISTSDKNAYVLNEMFKKELGYSKFYFCHRHPDRPWSTTLQATNKKFIREALNWLYLGSNIYLDRKYNRYLQIIKFIESMYNSPNSND